MKQIIALGGGGFSMSPDHLQLDRYILKQSSSTKPKICFIPTASGDAEGYIHKFNDTYRKLSAEPSHLSLFKPPTQDLEDFVMEKDVIFVGGGSTKNLLALWRDWGLDTILKKAYDQGIIMSGLSAGSICWFEQGVTDSVPGKLSPIESLGFISGSHCPHYDGEEERIPVFHQFILDGCLKDGIAIEEDAASHFINGELVRNVASRPSANVYKISRKNGAIERVALQTDYLER